MEPTKKKLTEQIALSRRNVIKLLIGGAVGTAVSPFPWKLTDDISIFSQNFPWVPVPSEGEFFHADSICTLCPGGCGIQVRKVDDRAVKIEGRTNFPVNPGGLCPLGAGGLQLLCNEEARFTGPMKRLGARGAGTFEKISWEEAIQELTDRIKGLRANGRSEALAAVDGNLPRSSMALMIQRFLKGAGSANYLQMPSLEETHTWVNRLMQGNDGPMAFDIENADFILSFGCGLIEGWGAPGRMINAWGLWRGDTGKRGVKIVQIESRASTTASKADQWLAPKPGTETALALGLAHVIIKEGLFNRAFVNRHTFGFTGWTDADGKEHKGFRDIILEKYAPEKVEKTTGVPAKNILSLARDFARAKAPIALFGKGKGDLNGSLLECMAAHSLNALVGNINTPGGVLAHSALPLARWPEGAGDRIAESGLAKGRIDRAGSVQYPFSDSLINNFAEAVLKSDPSPVDTLLVFNANPAFTLPDGGNFRRALQDIPYIVSFSPYRDETAYMSDLILPDHTYLEKAEDVVWPSGLQYPLFGVSRPVIEPIYDTRHSGDLLIHLAKKLGGGMASLFPWDGFIAAVEDRARGLSMSTLGRTRYDGAEPVWNELKNPKGRRPDDRSFDDMWQEILSNGMWYLPKHDYGNWETIFKTPTGKFEFCCTAIELALKALDKDPSGPSDFKNLGLNVHGDEALMPHFEAELDSGGTHGSGPGHNPEGKEAYPLLMVPYTLINLSSGWLPSPPYLYKTLLDNQLIKKDAFVEINPETADEYGLKQGDRAVIMSPKGERRVRINVFDGAMPGVIYPLRGLGHTAFDDFQRGKGMNVNELIDAARDPLTGQMVWWKTRVQIKKVGHI